MQVILRCSSLTNILPLKNSITSLQINCQVQQFLKKIPPFLFFTSSPYRLKRIFGGLFTSFFLHKHDFLVREFFRGNLKEAILLADTASFTVPWKTFLMRKLTNRCLIITSKLLIKLNDISMYLGFCNVVNNICSIWK